MLALETQKLVKVYAPPPGRGTTGLEALKGVDIQVEPGEFFALLGPNGAGKSTMIGILTCLVRKTSGLVNVFGHDLDTQPDGVKSCIGVVPQEFNFNIFESCVNTIVFQAGYHGVDTKTANARAETLMKDLELWDKRTQPARNLSGGMKRRLMLARALVTKPKLLILDEPTAGLDIELRRHLWDYLRKLNSEGTTIILTTHYLEEAELLCRRVAIIDKGNILKDCPIKELLGELKKQTFVLDVRGAAKATEDMPEGFRRIDDHTVEVDVDEGDTLNSKFSLLTDMGVEVSSMKNKTNRLEELFLRLVSANNEGKKPGGFSN